MKLAYLSYPFSDDPRGRTEEVRKLAIQMALKEADVFPIVPHLAFDFIINEPITDDIRLKILEAELLAIKSFDIFIIGHNPKSVGMLWEAAYAKAIGKLIMKVVLDAEGKYDHLEKYNGDEK